MSAQHGDFTVNGNGGDDGVAAAMASGNYGGSSGTSGTAGMRQGDAIVRVAGALVRLGVTRCWRTGISTRRRSSSTRAHTT